MEEHRQRWVSPRHDREHARRMAEERADQWEAELGRDLTPQELEALYDQADATTAAWGGHARRIAEREAHLGRPLTLAEECEMAKVTNRLNGAAETGD
jgi:hypothetical protein